MLLYIHRCAGVSEWQTMWTQNPLVVIPCGFDPHHRHKNPQPQGWGFLLVVGVEQSGGEQHRTSATAVVNTHNPLLDALLSIEYRDAAKHKVQLRLDLCDLEHFPLRDTELVTVMCNLLDNAIRAAEGTVAFLRIWFHRAMIDPGEQKAL